MLFRSVRLFDPADVLCSADLCRSHDRQGRLLYRDRDHLSARGALLLAPALERFLQRAGLLAAAGASPG